MEKIREDLKNEKDLKLMKRKTGRLSKIPKTIEERNEQTLIRIVEKLENMHDIMKKQDKIIIDLNEKVESLK